MAIAVNDTEGEKLFESIFDKGYEYTKNNLFNGNYFIQKVDIHDKGIPHEFDCSYLFWNEETKEISHQISDGCLIDQLVAQWHTELCGIGDVFDSDQSKKAALGIYKNNYKDSMRDVVNPWRLFSVNDDGGTIICSYPKDVCMPANPIPYAEEVMSGFEYAFAGVLLINGYMNEAENVISAVRKRYDGERGNPWNDTECGHNYARSMAAFSFIPLMSGFVADLCLGELKFSPRAENRPFKSVWFTGSSWGTFEINNGKTTIIVTDGSLELSSLNLPYLDTVTKIVINSQESDFQSGCGRVGFGEAHISAGTIIEIYGV